MSEQEPITYTSLASLDTRSVCASLDTRNVCASLEKDVMQLKECMECIQETVQLQQIDLDSIEDAIRSSQEDAKHAQNEITIADAYQSRYQYLMTIAGTAVVGIATLLFIL